MNKSDATYCSQKLKIRFSMKNSLNSSAQQPMIVKYVEALHNGIQSQALSRYAIGYILRGTKYIYEGDKRQTLTRGDVFYLGIGHHYIENFPENGQPFEQVLFYYTPADLQRILRNFFINTNNYLRDEDFRHDETAENIKMTELIYLIASHEDCCIKSKLLSNVDAAKENFEQIVYDHIFKDISIEELSKLTNRSLTSFKKEFRRHFQMPPHKWYIRQRLMHSRLLLISTSKSISEIGNACTFPNTLPQPPHHFDRPGEAARNGAERGNTRSALIKNL